MSALWLCWFLLQQPELVAEAARAEAAARQRQAHAAAQVAAAAEALAASATALEAAREGERAGRERLLAAQRRLSEALGLKSALMAHLREVQAEAAAAPLYAAQRHALRVGEAQSQVVEAAKVVSLAEFEVSASALGMGLGSIFGNGTCGLVWV